MVENAVPVPPMTVCLSAGYGRDNYITIKSKNAGDISKTVIEMNVSQAKQLMQQIQSIVDVLDGDET